MKNICPRLVVGSVAAMVFCSSAVRLLADKEYYLTIADRNPFALKSPLPAAPDKPLEPEKPLAVVRLTGITTMFHDPQALFEITEAPGKPPIKPILKIGERVGDVELLTIDISQNQVTIMNGHVQTNLTFEVAKTTTAPGALVPGRPAMFTTTGIQYPPPAPAPALINPASSGISPGMRGSTVVVGGNNAPASPTAPAATAAAVVGTGGSSTPSVNVSVSGNATVPAYVPRAASGATVDSALQQWQAQQQRRPYPYIPEKL